jgi:hypothetical protein
MSERTLAAFKWTFRDTCLWAAQNYSPAGGIDAVRRVLDELEVLDYPFGPGVSYRNQYDLARFPNGTVVSQYTPDNTLYNVWHVKGGRMHHLLGGGRHGRVNYLIDQMPGVDRPAWLDAEPAEDEAALVSAWKRRAWLAGWKAKERHSWCSDFETVMYGMEIRG